MRILIATDAWHPQVNGVVRTLTSLARSAASLDAEISFLTPDGFPSVGVPTYPGLRVALPNRARDRAPDRGGRAGGDPYRHRRPDRLGGARLLPPPQARIHHVLHHALSGICRGPHHDSGQRRLRACCGTFMRRPRPPWSRPPRCGRSSASAAFASSASGPAASTPNCSRRTIPATLDLPRPIFMTMGRVAVEKNLEAFLSLDLPGTKVVVGDGPQRAQLAQKYPDAVFLGEKKGEDLPSHLAAADVFVFPSLTDTFGVVQLEALACGTPVAAFPVTGPLDVIADHPIGALDADLRSACLRALTMSREACRNFALARSWENSARQFIGNLTALQPSRVAAAGAPHPRHQCRAGLNHVPTQPKRDEKANHGKYHQA